MDLVTILVVALAGALALFFLAPRSPAAATVSSSASHSNNSSKKSKKSKKKKSGKSSKPSTPAPEPEPEVEEEQEEEEEQAQEEAPKKAPKRTKKQRQKAAAKARKAAEAEEARKAEQAAKKAAKKKARKARQAQAAADTTTTTTTASDADVAAALAAEEEAQAASWEDDDDDAGEWEDISAIRKAKKQSPKRRGEGKTGGGGGPTVRKTIDVGRSIPALMGKGGSNIQAIREATGVNITIPKREENSSVVTVVGSADGVTAALEMIQAKIDGNGSPRVDDRDSATITIEEGDVRLVIGRGGSTIKLIEDECGASLNVSKEGTPTVVIRGDQDQIAAAKQLIAKVIAGRGLLNGVRETIALRDGQARVVIGARGATVNRIKDSTGAQLKISDTQVEIFGTPEQVKAAATAVAGLLADYASATMEVDGRQCGTIIGSKGATISKLQRESGASINVDSDSNVVTISGSKAAVAKAQAAITAVLEAPRTFSPLEDGVSSETMELGNSVSRVIGRRGATVQKISSETGAKLDFIDQTCRISGTDEQVAEAQKAVQAILDAEAKRAEAQERMAAERAAAAAAAVEAGEGDDDEDGLDENDLMDAAGW